MGARVGVVEGEADGFDEGNGVGVSVGKSVVASKSDGPVVLVLSMTSWEDARGSRAISATRSGVKNLDILAGFSVGAMDIC